MPRPVRAVGNQVEHLEYDLTDQHLAQRRPDDAVRRHLPVADPHGDGARQRSFVAPFVGVRNEGGPPLLQSQAFDHVLRQEERDGPGIDDAVNGRAPDFGFLAVSAIDMRSVARVLQCHFGVDLSHGQVLDRCSAVAPVPVPARSTEGTLYAPGLIPGGTNRPSAAVHPPSTNNSDPVT